jgi:ComF family protein
MNEATTFFNSLDTGFLTATDLRKLLGEKLKNIFEGLLELIYPTHCASCGRFGQLICQDCLDSLPLIEPKFCLKCGKPSYYLVSECRDCRNKRFVFFESRSLGLYEGNLRELVHKFKYGNCRGLAEIFADLLVEHIESNFFEVDAVTYVPLSRRKKDERGFNQAQLLAEKIALKLNLPFLEVLCQDKETQDQSKLQAVERRKNVKGAFSVKRDLLPKGSKVLLVDDVFTTGSTVNECSRVLRASGTKSVKVVTIARATHLV